ncbi:hypothetical protein AB0478_27045 [Streptomyces sp. NPDC051917]|uniref:hypothetical protein n=1 Tax=Streptomyces sp. NPDC051917 TaxID=3154754 RepID=UPI00344B9479
MALPRKGARHIVVDGTTYRWRLRRRPTYAQSMAWTPGTFAVEHADSPGTTLVVTTGHAHPGNRLGHACVPPVRPADVAVAVRRALREGWNSTSPGSPVHLDGGGG